MTKRNFKLIISGILALCVCALLLCIATALRQASFEKSSSYDFAQRYVSALKDEKLEEKLFEYAEAAATEYESISKVKASLSSLVKNKDVSITKADDYTSKSPKFDVYLSGKLTFSLKLKNKAAFLRHPSWKISSFKIHPENDLTFPVYIQVPISTELTLNGIPVDDTNAVYGKYHALSKFEESSVGAKQAQNYEAGNFFLTPSIVAVYKGVRIQPEKIQNSAFLYSYLPSETHNLSFTVPDGAAVTVNGILLDKKYCESKSVQYPFLSRFEIGSASAVSATNYVITGLFEEAEVKVSYNGKALSCDEKGLYKLPSEMSRDITLCVPDYAVVKINGIALGKSEISAKKLSVPIFDGMNTHIKSRHYMTEYKVKGLLSNPVISVTDASGMPLKVNPYDSTEAVTFYSCTESTFPYGDTEQITNFVKKYVNYVYSGSSHTQDNLSAASVMTPASSKAYALLKESYYSIQKKPVHTSIICDKFNVLNYYKHSSNGFSAIIEVPFSAVLDGNKIQKTLTLEILYYYSGSNRRVVNFRILSEA